MQNLKKNDTQWISTRGEKLQWTHRRVLAKIRSRISLKQNINTNIIEPSNQIESNCENKSSIVLNSDEIKECLDSLQKSLGNHTRIIKKELETLKSMFYILFSAQVLILAVIIKFVLKWSVINIKKVNADLDLKWNNIFIRLNQP